MIPARVEQAIFDRLAPKLIQRIGREDPRSATGVVADVLRQMNEEFAAVPPVTLHAPVPELMAGVWGMLRETIVAGPVDRALREVVCESVSAVNRCSFCVDAHSTLLTGMGLRKTADLIRAQRPDRIADPIVRAIAEWAFANRSPGADILRRPPFTLGDAPEIIGSAICFHYLARMVSVFLPDSPVPLPPGLRGLRGTAVQVAGATVGKRVMALDVAAGAAAGNLPESAPSAEFDWARTQARGCRGVGQTRSRHRGPRRCRTTLSGRGTRVGTGVRLER